MKDLRPESFFDLSSFEYKEIFDLDQPVWHMLSAMNHWMEASQSRSFWSIRCPIPEGVTLVHEELIDIAKDCIIEPGCFIAGPCVLGSGTQVRHGAYIRGHLLAGKDCVIGHTTEVKNAIMLDHAKAGHFAYIGDSILGQNVNLGAGVKCANLRLDQSELAIAWQDQLYRTKMRKLGAILGDGCQIGCNSVLNPGTLLGPDCAVWPLTSVHGVYPASSKIRDAAKG